MNEDTLKQLYETFTLSEREGQGGMKFKYVPNEDVVNRMNKIFMGNWSTEVRDKDIVDDQVVLEVRVSITDPEDSRVHTHTGFGSQQIMRYTKGPNAGKIIDIGNAYKGALSKAIVNACTRWGVGLFKERNAYEIDNITPVEENGSAPALGPIMIPTVSVPETTPVAYPTPTVPDTTAAPAPTPYKINETATAAPLFAPPVARVTAAMPSVPAVPTPVPVVEVTTDFPPVPPSTSNQTVSAAIAVTQAPVETMPKIPIPNEEPSIVVPATPDLPFSIQPNGDKISDVQRVALNGILSMRNIQYEDLAKEAFDFKGITKPIPNKEELSYEDAVVVIKFGNDKYRKGNS